jgi:hypothetical protein
MQDRKATTKSAMALLIHRVEILKPQSNCREQAVTRFEPQSGILSEMGIFRQLGNQQIRQN